MNDDPKLRQTLRAWSPELADQPRFSAEVWRRIREREEVQSATGWAAFVEWLFPSRVAWQLAAVTAAVLIAAGAGLGNFTAASANERNRAQLAFRYAQSVDPYLQVSFATEK